MKPSQAKFWALHMTDDLRAPTPKFPEPLPPFSIQILAKGGGPTELIGYLKNRDTELVIDGHTVPSAVIEAVKKLPVGAGEYFDDAGQVVAAF
jgi:hypothetical protein